MKKGGLTLWEKLAIAIIVLLIVSILFLIFNEKLMEYWEAFRSWYEGGK
ncbi:MAG: hypothetical protein JW770_05190 [Actinobacteria bacterium]|nr:hypothetical protein [Actinomycetota bacterium]